MLSYVTIGAADMDQSRAFYDQVLATIGWKRHADFGVTCGYSEDGSGEGQSVWVCLPHDKQSASFGNGMMVAFSAKDQAQVRAFYDAALAAGGSDDGPPGPRPNYSPTWYAAYMRDPIGNKLAIVCF